MRENKRMKSIARAVATSGILGFGITFVEISGKMFFAISNSIQFYLTQKTIFFDFSLPVLLDVFLIMLIVLVGIRHKKNPKESMLDKIYRSSGILTILSLRASEFLFPILIIVSVLTKSPYFMNDIHHFVLSAIVIVLFEVLLQVGERWMASSKS